MDPTGRFVALVRAPGRDVPLDEAALLMSAHANAGLDVAAQLRRLDTLARECPPGRVDALTDLLFGRLGLRGDRVDYGDPRNSFLDQVLDRGLGIPISLSVLTMVMAGRLGLEIEGVGMPGHFLVRDRADPGHLIDPFHQGRRLDRGQCRQLFHDLHGPEAAFSDRLLAPTRPKLILARMLTNLTNSYTRLGDTTALTWTLRLRGAIPDLVTPERVQLAAQLSELGRFDDAAGVLEELADDTDRDGTAAPSASESSDLRTRALRLRSRLN